MKLSYGAHIKWPDTWITGVINPTYRGHHNPFIYNCFLGPLFCSFFLNLEDLGFYTLVSILVYQKGISTKPPDRKYDTLGMTFFRRGHHKSATSPCQTGVQLPHFFCCQRSPCKDPTKTKHQQLGVKQGGLVATDPSKHLNSEKLVQSWLLELFFFSDEILTFVLKMECDSFPGILLNKPINVI